MGINSLERPSIIVEALFMDGSNGTSWEIASTFKRAPSVVQLGALGGIKSSPDPIVSGLDIQLITGSSSDFILQVKNDNGLGTSVQFTSNTSRGGVGCIGAQGLAGKPGPTSISICPSAMITTTGGYVEIGGCMINTAAFPDAIGYVVDIIGKTDSSSSFSSIDMILEDYGMSIFGSPIVISGSTSMHVTSSMLSPPPGVYKLVMVADLTGSFSRISAQMNVIQ